MTSEETLSAAKRVPRIRSARMRPHVVTFWILIAMFLQIAVQLFPHNLRAGAEVVNHMMVHSQDIKHHHHLDRTFHQDQGENSARHFHADAENGASALVSPDHLQLVPIQTVSPVEWASIRWSTPTLEGPLRPPKFFC